MALGRNDEQLSLLENAVPIDSSTAGQANNLQSSRIDIELDDDFLNNSQVPDADDLVKSAPRLNIGQRMIGSAATFLTTYSGLVWGSAIALDEDATEIPVPGDYAVPAVGAIGAKEAIDSLRVISQREHPLDYLTLEGGGSFAKGLAMEAGKKIAAAIPAVLFSVGMSYGRDALFNYAMQDPENNMTLMLGLSYFNTPLLRSLLITVPSLLLYAFGQKIIERCVPGMRPPEMPPEENAELHWYQTLLADGLDVANGVTLAGLGRQIFMTLGPELVLHSSFSMLMGPASILFVLALMHYLSENPHPFNNVRDFVGEIGDMFSRADVNADDANAPAEAHEDEAPSKARIAANIGIKVGIALGVFALAALVNRYASAAISDLHPENSGDNDPSGWTTGQRVGYEAALIAGVIYTQRLIENIPAIVNKVREDGPDAIKSVRDGASSAAHKAASGARKIGASVAGLFSGSGRQRSPALVLSSIPDLSEDDFALLGSDDEDVISADGFTI